MRESDHKRRPCAACGQPVGTATIVAGGDFPNEPICLKCFNHVEPFQDLPAAIRARQAKTTPKVDERTDHSQDECG